MQIRKIVIAGATLFITLFSISTAYAQTGLDARRDTAAIRIRWEQMKADLQLTDVQTDSISTIHKEFQNKRDAVSLNRQLSGPDKMTEYKSLMQDLNQRLKATLGQDLFTKYETWMHDHPHSGKSGKK